MNIKQCKKTDAIKGIMAKSSIADRDPTIDKSNWEKEGIDIG